MYFIIVGLVSDSCSSSLALFFKDVKVVTSQWIWYFFVSFSK